MPKQIEKQLVENYAAEKLQGLGWKFVEASQLKRESAREPLLIDNFKEAILKINKDLNISDEEIKKVIDEVRLLTSGQEGIKKFLHFLKYGIGVKFEKERIVKIVNLFDFENIENNEFVFSKQIRHKEKDLIIPDIILYVNGIPLVDIECKSPTSLRVSWEEGYQQIKKYEKLTPELYKYIQIGIALAEKARYFPVVPWQENVSVYLWREGELPEDEAIFGLLKPDVLLDILRNFLFIREEHGEMTKVIARYMQYRAANKIYQRVIDNLKGRDAKNKGLVWHWQGSGKTLTMIFAGHKLFFDKRLENPTIFFIIDRRDLENQMNNELSSLRLNFSFEKIGSVRKLKEVISHDNFRGKRGVFLTLIHKFSPEEKFVPEELLSNIQLSQQGISLISERKNVVCFLDEVHRSQYGLLAAQMKKVLQNAFFFGFTGTPIAEDERNTYTEFGYPLKEEGYLDKYFIDDSQKDGFTLPLVYQPRLEKLHIKEDELRLFLERVQSEDITETEKEKIEKSVRQKLNYISVFLENEKRVRKIAKDIADHFKENVDGKFKGMVVSGSRKACVLYKKYLDQYLPANYSEVVMTFNLNDKEPIKDFYKEWGKRYSGLPDDEHRTREIVESFKEKEFPKILIVTDMLITGFDAPILQTMYLDKLLKKHRLLQAIARVNRPYKDVKPVGLIIDYVGVLKNINAALRQYYKEDTQGIIANFPALFETFKEITGELEKIFSGIEFSFERENLMKAVDRLRSEEIEQEFMEKYKEARKLFEILGAYPRKIEFLEKFKWFTAVYEYWLKLTISETEKEKVEKYFQKTVEIIHQETEIQEIEKSLPQVSLDINYLAKIQKSSLSSEEKAVNMLFALEKLVLVHQRQNPIYKTIADQLEELIRKWKEREIEYKELFKEESKIIDFIEKKEQEREELKFSPFEFGMLSLLNIHLKEENKSKLREFVGEIISLIKEDLIENWQKNPMLKQNIERKLRTFALKLKKDYRLTYDEFDTLHKELVSFIKDYAER
ncbi:MAG: putative type I restriction-modification enzyme, subunit R [Parcubacteria bacterium 32_520]|nr:MAG: putative type I restriction-modification enzyme, subunit R [Parcubacteria bacterium 32_520]